MVGTLLTERPDYCKRPGQWTGPDLRAGETVRDESRRVAAADLDVVVEAVTGDGGRPPTDGDSRFR